MGAVRKNPTEPGWAKPPTRSACRCQWRFEPAFNLLEAALDLLAMINSPSLASTAALPPFGAIQWGFSALNERQ
jgi:hypothetical protein